MVSRAAVFGQLILGEIQGSGRVARMAGLRGGNVLLWGDKNRLAENGGPFSGATGVALEDVRIALWGGME